MARPLRIEFDGAFYHVTSRGNARQNIYHKPSDYLLFLDTLGEVCNRYNWLVHCYCLMTNHYHLVIETPEGNLSSGMRQLNSVFTQRFNRQRGSSGHVLQGRYKSILVNSEVYYKTLIRYVLQNPVRAKMVLNAGDYHWSSYNAFLGKFNLGEWLQTDVVLSHFHENKQIALVLFQEYIDEVVDHKIWDNLSHQVFLGDETFAAKFQRDLPTSLALSEVPNSQKRRNAKPLAYYKDKYEVRSEAIAEAFMSGSYTMAKIADYFGVHYSTVSRIIARFKI